MPRQARLKVENASGTYHAWNAVACRKGEYPLSVPYVRQKFFQLLKFYLSIYCCKLAAHSCMGNHWHLVLHFDQPHPLSRDMLTARARKLYPEDRSIATWPQKRWKRFEQRLFEISKFMANFEQAFSTWYDRKGHFWAGRYKSNILEGPQALLDAVTYVELNGVRAGLVPRPEEYVGGSLFLREARQDGWLMPLEEVLPDPQLRGEALYERFLTEKLA